MTIDIDNNPKYEQLLHNEAGKSFILAGSTSVNNPPLNSLQDVQNEIYALSGNENGLVVRKNGSSFLALIPSLRQSITDVVRKFSDYSDKRRLQGFETPTELPPSLLDEMMLYQAKLEIRHKEVLKLNELKDSFLEQELQKRKREILKYGLRCDSTGHVPIKAIDGQHCKIIDGEAYIVDQLSPYNGMLVKDYRKLSAQWIESRKEIEAKDVNSWKKTFSKADLPEWPDYAKKNKLSAGQLD